MKTKTSWKVKMNKPIDVEVKPGPEIWNQTYHGSMMVIPTPRLIEGILFEIPTGKILTNSQLKEIIADRTHADYACPLTTGIFLRICSEYAEELRHEGIQNIPPYWRIVKDDGSLNEKFPGGVANHYKLLKAEGHSFHYLGSRKKRIAVVFKS